MLPGEPLNLGPLEERDRVALAQLHVGLLPAGTRAAERAAALRLRLHLDDVDAHDLHIEELLDGLADLRLVRVLVDAERIAALARAVVALLRDDRREQDLRGLHLLTVTSRADRARAPRKARVARTQGVPVVENY